jgi:hypothetical protein
MTEGRTVDGGRGGAHGGRGRARGLLSASAPILQKTLKPGSRIVSHRFTMGDWTPEKTEKVNSTAGYECEIHLWTVSGKK